MTHRRSPRISLVPVSDLQVSESVKLDPKFQAKIIRVMRGDAEVALTRLPASHITEGHYRWTAGQPEHVVNRELVEAASLLAPAIRGGHRPSLDVYWSPLNPKPEKYVCPDAEAAILAYRELGISEIPVRILEVKKKRLTSSAVCIHEAGENEGFSRFIPISRDAYESLLGDSDLEPEQAIRELAVHTFPVEANLVAFHKPHMEIHHHHALQAQIKRHRDLLTSIGLLMSRGRIDHCFALMRLMYESFLNHYLDWLSPEVFGPRLQAISVFRRYQARERAAGRVCKDEEFRDALGGLMPLLESVEQKAQLSPFGIAFYRYAYPSLSFVVHQDYGEKEASLDAGADGTSLREDARIIAVWADAITTALLSTIQSDIGMAA